MSDEADQSIDFSLGDDKHIKNLFRDINSSYSLEASFSFEVSDDLADEDLSFKEEEGNPAKKKGRNIPEDLKRMSEGFVSVLFKKYANNVYVPNNNYSKNKKNINSNVNTESSNNRITKVPQLVRVVFILQKFNTESRQIPSQVAAVKQICDNSYEKYDEITNSHDYKKYKYNNFDSAALNEKLAKYSPANKKNNTCNNIILPPIV